METFYWLIALAVVIGGVIWLLRYLDKVDDPPDEPLYQERIGLAAVEHELKKTPVKQPKKPVKKITKRKGAKK